MNARRKAVWILAISLVCALAMLAAAALIHDTARRHFVVFMLVALWFIPFTYLSTRQKCNTCSPQSEESPSP